MPTLTAAIIGSALLMGGTQAVISNQSRIANEKANDKIRDQQDKVMAERKAIKDQEEANALSTATRIAARRSQRDKYAGQMGRAGTILTTQTGVPSGAGGAVKELIGE